MILCLGAAFQDAECTMGVERGTGDQFEEIGLAQVMRAGARHKDAARSEEAQGA